MTAGQAADVRRRSTCRVCGGTNLELVLSLGPTALANAFLQSPDEFAGERRYPLDLYVCAGCSLAQLLDVVDPEVLFRHYLYVTGTSATMAAHNRAYAATLVQELELGAGDLVVEAAANDGSLLRAFATHGVRTLGIEPARNLAAEARRSGIDMIDEFFNLALARRLRAERGPARAVVANNVLAHVDDPRDLLAGCGALVDDAGLVVVEVPYVGDLVDRVEYDTIYHEHLSYFSVAAMLQLARAAGLSAVRVDRLPVHGGSLRWYLSPSSGAPAAAVVSLAEEERRRGLTGVARYRQFAAAVHESRRALVDLLGRLSVEGRRVAGYGAPAKGTTLLNFCGIDTRLVPYTVDKNPRKVGLYTPGVHIPVRDVGALRAEGRDPDFVLILAWNLAEEIMQQLSAYRDRGGRFIIPVPRAEIV